MSNCKAYDPDNVFRRFKVIEFPISFVGLWSSRYLNVEIDLDRTAYLKTMCEGSLMKFEEARQISPSHRAFSITQTDSYTILLTYHPTNESICHPKHRKKGEDKFIFDLRLIKVDGSRCCYNELHSEVGRFYISGQYEYCKLSHTPKIVDFGDVLLSNELTKKVRIYNESKLLAAKFEFVRVTGYEVFPQSFIVKPNSSLKIGIKFKPVSLKVANILHFEVRNTPMTTNDSIQGLNDDGNFIKYTITCTSKVIYSKKKAKAVVVESLHNLYEKHVKYTYIDPKEITIRNHRKEMGLKQLQLSKAIAIKPTFQERLTRDKEQCYDNMSMKTPRSPKHFCESITEPMTIYDLFDIIFFPFTIDFGRVGLMTYGQKEVKIENNTKYNMTLHFYHDQCVRYTEKKLDTYEMKLMASGQYTITIFCLGFVEGNFTGHVEYVIDKKYSRKLAYALQVENPTLMIAEKCINFGMINLDSYITSAHIKIHNYFNIPVNFQWDEMDPDAPFEIIPSSGCILQHLCNMCEITYICKPTKSTIHEADLISQSNLINVIPIELCIIKRKLCIKFLQESVTFQDIALNIKTIEHVKMENASREMAVFQVIDPSMPGLTIEPMSGVIHPKNIVIFSIIVEISCVLEFAFDFCVKINDKEFIILPVIGNVVEPKIVVNPKIINVPKVPCHMITYVPVSIQNLSARKSDIEIIDTGDEDIFEVYMAYGNEKLKANKFSIDSGQSKTVYIKVYDTVRREYENMYIPFKFNNLIGPPSEIVGSTDLRYFTKDFEIKYVNDPRVKLKFLNKLISTCRLSGVITVPWIQFSINSFEIEYVPRRNNSIEFSMKNISKCYLYIAIIISKLSPFFSLKLLSEETECVINENIIKFEFSSGKMADFILHFHPKCPGRFVSTAVMYLDKQMTTPFYNMTFIGKRQAPVMIPSTTRVIFPPCCVGTKLFRVITIRMRSEADKDEFSIKYEDDCYLTVEIVNSEHIEENDKIFTQLTVEILIACDVAYARNLTVSFIHVTGSSCEVDINFCLSYCPLTLHTSSLVSVEENPYPYYPLDSQFKLYDYMQKCIEFLEKWMYQQGFHKDLFPIIPDTFYAISDSMISKPKKGKIKGINISYLNFIKRIAGPLMKHINNVTAQVLNETFKPVKEIHDTYKEIVNLLKLRGVDLWVLQPRFLLSYEQFVVYSENVIPPSDPDMTLTQELLDNAKLFNRLSKQSWIDFILQSYKAFVIDSCFFDCVCVSKEHRDIMQVLVSWYNDLIMRQHKKLTGKDKPVRTITNITKDLRDGLGLVSAILTYCPFLEDQLSGFCDVSAIDGDDNMKTGGIINNACLFIEALNQLKINFPICCKEFLDPNFLQFFFLSVHLYVVLPMFQPKDIIKFCPSLLRCSTRQLTVSSANEEPLICSFLTLNNYRNSFIVEKAESGENEDKILLNTKFVANFIDEESCILLVHGYNKTRIFDTYVVFLLQGEVGALYPAKKCKVSGQLYLPSIVNVVVSSPFPTPALFSLCITNVEPSLPVKFEKYTKPKFYSQRINLIDKEILLSGLPKDKKDDVDKKLFLKIVCLSTEMGASWVWFRSEIGEFFIRVTSQPRWDLPMEILESKLETWPLDPCSCGEACECYRTTSLLIPHRNELKVKALREALIENASETMMEVFNYLIGTILGKKIISILLNEGGTNMSDVDHILCEDITYRVTSKTVKPRIDRVTLAQHSCKMLPLPITLLNNVKSGRYSIVLISDCGMDIRTYDLLFTEDQVLEEESRLEITSIQS